MVPAELTKLSALPENLDNMKSAQLAGIKKKKEKIKLVMKGSILTKNIA